MWLLAGAVLSASLLGSMHCVGMCGPLAIWATGGGEKHDRRRMWAASGMYHVGRLLTYAAVGAVAGGIGSLVDFGGAALGVQLLAARIVGSLMIAAGAIQLWRIFSFHFKLSAGAAAKPLKPSIVTRLLVRIRPAIFRLPLPARGMLTGLLTAFLPCGWLYLFALVSAGTGSVGTGSLVMLAFWLGTVPALIALVASTQALAFRFKKIVPVGMALVLMLAGGYTLAGRGFAQLHSLNEIEANQVMRPLQLEPGVLESTEGLAVGEQIQMLTETKLPCCCESPE